MNVSTRNAQSIKLPPTVGKWPEAQKILVRDGDSVPSAGPNHTYVFTGRSFETFPLQFEYQRFPNTVLVRDGEQPPELPAASMYTYVKTGRVFETFPVQYEYMLLPPNA